MGIERVERRGVMGRGSDGAREGRGEGVRGDMEKGGEVTKRLRD
jgi:hypothetical protein